MNLKRAVPRLFAIVVVTSSLAPSEAEKEWNVGATDVCRDVRDPCIVNAGEATFLHNRFIRKSVGYGSREYGVNLVWKDGRSRGIRFVRASGSTGALTLREPFAVYVEGGKYLKYESREYGINLVWSDTPVYEWEFRGCDASRFSSQAYCVTSPTRPGTGTINSYRPVGLFNRTSNDYVVYCEREYGINLKWAKDCNRDPIPEPEYARSIVVALKLSGTQSSGDCASSGRVRYTFSPVRLTRTPGLPNDPVSVAQRGVTIRHSAEQTWNAPRNCIVQTSTSVAAGVWKLEAENFVGWKTSCEVEVAIAHSRLRSTDVSMTFNSGGCISSTR